MERNKFIRDHRLEERVGNQLDEVDKLRKSVEKEGNRNKKAIKIKSLMAVKKHLRKKAEEESKKAVDRARLIYGNDTKKLNQIEEETKNDIYKKSYKQVV